MRWLESNDLGLVLVALIGLIGSWFGGSRIKDSMTGAPQKSAAPLPERTVEIAGALVSDKAVDKMVASMDALAAALNESGKRIDRNSDVSEEMRDDIREVNRTMEGLKAEFIRAGVHK